MNATDAFRNNLRWLIESGKTTATALHEQTGISRSSIRGWIEGENAPNLSQIERIAGALEIQAIDLLKEARPAPHQRTIESYRCEAVELVISADLPQLKAAIALLKEGR